MRSWRPPQQNPVDPVPGRWQDYQSFQKIINSNDGQLNPELFEQHLEMMMNDTRWRWEEVNPVSFEKLTSGDRIRYISITQKNEIVFRTGGWIRAIAEDHTWLAYMAHTMTSWTLQVGDVQRLWVIKTKNRSRNKKENKENKEKKEGRKGRKRKDAVEENTVEENAAGENEENAVGENTVGENEEDGEDVKEIIKYVLFDSPGPKTGHDTYLPDKEGNLIHVRSFPDEWGKKRFENSKRVKEILKGDRPWKFKN